MNQRLSEHFSSHAATDALAAHGDTLLAAARDWLTEYEPAFFAKVGEKQVIDTAMQAIMAAEAARADGDGGPAVRALAHQVALFMVQQTDLKGAWAGFGQIVQAHINELHDDMRAAQAGAGGAA